MAVKTRETEHAQLPVNQWAGWARQGFDTFMAAQKIMLDLVGQQNLLVVGMVRERMGKPGFRPGHTIAENADNAVQAFADAGKILLDMAAGQTELLVDGVKEGVPLPAAACAVANLLRDRVMTILDLETRLLQTAAEQTHEAATSYRQGKGWMATGASAVEFARRGIEHFVHTEKEFLDLAAHEIHSAAEGNGHNGKSASDRYKVLVRTLRASGEKYIDAQKRLLNMAVEQMENARPSKAKNEARDESRTSWRDVGEKSIRNVAAAQKSLTDLVVKPAKAAPVAPRRKRARTGPATPVVGMEERKTA